MQIDNLVQLVDFQNSTWTYRFIELRCIVKNMEQNRLNNENDYRYL